MTQPPSSWGSELPHDGSGPPQGAPTRLGAVFPLRRMSLGEILGAGTAMLRHAPRAVLGVPILAGLVTFLLMMLAHGLFPTPLAGLQNQMMTETWSEDQMLSALGEAMPYYVSTLLITILQNVLLAIGFALIVIPTMRAAWGWPTDFLQTLMLRRGRLGALIGSILVIGLLVTGVMLIAGVLLVLITVVTFGIGALVALPAFVLLSLWLTAGLMYAPLTVLVERRGPLQAISRSWTLNTGRWWATIGTLALITLIMFVISLILGLISALVSVIAADSAVAPGGITEPTVGSTITLAISTLITSLGTSLITAVTGAMVSVMYLNARFRREGLDVALMAGAEGAHDDGETVPGSVEHLGELPVAAPAPDAGQQIQPDPYGQPGPYGQPDPSSQPGPYGQPYGQQNLYGQPAPYSGQNPYGGQDPYGSPDPSGRQNPYGRPEDGDDPGRPQ